MFVCVFCLGRVRVVEDYRFLWRRELVLEGVLGVCVLGVSVCVGVCIFYWMEEI